MHSESEDHRGQSTARTVCLYVIGLAIGALTQALVVPLTASLLVRVLPMETLYGSIVRLSHDSGIALMGSLELLHIGGWAFVAGLLYGRWATVSRVRAGLAVGIGGASVWVAAMFAYPAFIPVEVLPLKAIGCIVGGAAGGALAPIKPQPH